MNQMLDDWMMVDRQKSDIRHRISDIGHRISDIGHRTSDIGHRTSDIGHPKTTSYWPTARRQHQYPFL
jgi:hypothetical protein